MPRSKKDMGLSNEKCTVKGRKFLNEMRKNLTICSDLVRDGFSEYDRMKNVNDIFVVFAGRTVDRSGLLFLCRRFAEEPEEESEWEPKPRPEPEPDMEIPLSC